MIRFMFILLFLYCFVYSSRVPDSIKLVHVISRHGERTPADTYPMDPYYMKEDFYPFGWGQLTNNGKRQQYELGKFLRKSYGKFLGNIYSQDVIYAQSTDSDRTMMSAQLQLAALFPPKDEQIWRQDPELNWQPIPVHYEPLNQDQLLLMRLPCPRYYEIQKQVLNLEEIQKQVFNQTLYEYLTENTGSPIRCPDDVQSLYSTLKAQEDFGLELPEWTAAVYPRLLAPIAAKSFDINAYTAEMKRLKSGLLLKKIAEDIEGKLNGSKIYEKRKIFLFVGHDSTVANFLRALNVWETQIPQYNAMAILELHVPRNGVDEEQEPFVKVKFRNGMDTNRVQHLNIPGCGKTCPVSKFSRLLAELIPTNISTECQSRNKHFKPPEQSDP